MEVLQIIFNIKKYKIPFRDTTNIYYTSAFHLKRLYVLGKTHLRLKENVLAFCDERKDVFLCLFSGLEKRCFQTSSAPMMSRTELYP